jgi:hypothetical protein
VKEELRVAVIVNPHLPIGLMANTIGAVSIGLGAKLQGLGGHRLTDLRGRTIDVSSNRPVPILQATAEEIARLLLKAISQADDRTVVPFPSFARSLHDYADYEAVFRAMTWRKKSSMVLVSLARRNGSNRSPGHSNCCGEIPGFQAGTNGLPELVREYRPCHRLQRLAATRAG